ncbi:hypothetical protein BRD00_05480 [Halobacteriales archaeon QS_8_69_26]|nr:MAG: hypothetical protein BRD00_05480 [Halobacteriales archaeon QS_8_69_26]
MDGRDTIDWDGYWRGDVDGGPMDAAASSDTVEYLVRFVGEVGVPRSFAAVGCGEGAVPATVASEYPETEVWGYDVSESVIDRNRSQYGAQENLSFGVASLPETGIDRQFGVVYCYATLPYVRDVELALRDLYSLVEPGGYLVVNYPNEEFCETYAEGIEEGTPLYRRFELVCNRVNEISRDRIATLLGVPAHDYWDFVDAPDDVHGALSWYPCVYVQKPPD